MRCTSTRGSSTLAVSHACSPKTLLKPVGRPSRNSSQVCKATWLECSANIDCDVPVAFAYKLMDDRESIPKFMNWITSVKVMEEEPALSQWKLETTQFNRTWELSWLARNLAPIRNQKIHWKSVPGSTVGIGGLEVENTGEIRFARRPDGCNVRLSIRYSVPDPLVPFGSALNPLVESILDEDMVRFREFAKQQQQQLA